MRLSKQGFAILMALSVSTVGYTQVIQSSGSGSGAWSDPASWTPSTVPTSANSTAIVINTGHTIQVDGNFTVDQLVIDGALLVNTSRILTIANGTGTDITVGTGSLTVSGTLAGSNGYTFSGLTVSNTSFLSSSVYQHMYTTTEGAIPIATWNAASTLDIIGYTSSINATAGGNWSQNFGHVIYNSPQGPNTIVSFEGLLTSVQGNFTALSTGANANNRLNLASSQNVTVTIGGDFSIVGNARAYLALTASNFILTVGGDFTVSSSRSPACFTTLSGTSTLNVAGDFTIAVSNSIGLTNTTTGGTNVNLQGDFNLLGTISVKSGSHGRINFTGATTKKYVDAGVISGPLGLNVLAGATVDFGTSIFPGTGVLIVSGTIELGSTDVGGAYQNGSVGGNIRNTGSRTFNTGSIIAYNGLARQYIVTHPSVAGVTIDNVAGVELTGNFSVSGVLTFQSGSLVLSNFALTATGVVNTVSGNIQSTGASSLSILGSGAFNSIAFSGSPATIGTLVINRTGIVAGLSSDLIVATALTLSSNSVLDITNHSLTISGNFTSSSAARIAASSTSNLVVNGSGTVGFFRFRTGNSNLNNWTINKPSTTISLGTPLNLFGVLNVQSSGTTFAAGSGLSLQSTNDNPARDGSIATLPSGSSVTGSVTVNRYMSAEGDMNRYISSPITNASVAQLQDDFPVTGTAGSFIGQSNPCTGCSAAFSLKYYDETSLGAFNNTYRRYPLATNTETLQVGRGYLAYMWNGENQITWDVTGPINQGNINLPITYTQSSPARPADDGWNLVGNPYPSTIRWDDVVGWTMNDIAPIVYVTDNAAGGIFRSWNPVDNTGDLAGGLIATGQAFWVYAEASGASLIVHETAKTTPGTGSFYRQAAPSEHLIVSMFKGASNVKDNAFLILNEEATNGYDRLYEVSKLQNESFDIALVDAEKRTLGRLALSEIEDHTAIPVSIRVTEAGEYTISFTEKNDFSYSQSLKLLDTQTGTSSSISDSYTFKVSQPGIINDRFILFQTSVTKLLNNEMDVTVFPNPVTDNVQVIIPTDQAAKLTLLNAIGQVVGEAVSENKEGVNQHTFEMLSMNNGIYYIQVRMGARQVTRKIIKQ